jgi:hypothetical protein
MRVNEKTALQLMVKGTGSFHVIERVAETLLKMNDESLNRCPSRHEIGRLAGVSERSARRAIRHMADLACLREEVGPRNTRRIYPNKIKLLAILDRLP